MGCIKSILLSLRYPRNFGIVGAITYNMLEVATKRTFFEVLPKGIPYKFNKAQNILTFTHNGSQIAFRSCETPDRLKGPNCGFVFVDEGSSIPEDTFMILQGRIRLQNVPDEARQIFICSNPEGENWLWRKFCLSPSESFELIKAPSTENHHLPKDYIENLLTSYPRDWIRRYVYGEFNTFAGQIYKEFDEKIHVTDRIEVLPQHKFMIGVDYGYANPTAILFSMIDVYGNVMFFDEIYEQGVLVSDLAEMTKDKMGRYGIIDPYFVIDPSCKSKHGLMGKSVVDEFREFGIYCRPGNNHVEAGINRVSEYLKVQENHQNPWTQQSPSPHLFIHPRCVNLIREVKSYRWQENRMGLAKNQPEKPVKDKDHAVDAMRYVLMTRPSPTFLENHVNIYGTFGYYMRQAKEKLRSEIHANRRLIRNREIRRIHANR